MTDQTVRTADLPRANVGGPEGGDGVQRLAADATPQRRLRHIPALDGLRGLAVLGVLWFHGGHLSGGYLGVDLFFVLSGYLITSLLLSEWRTSGNIRLGNFWARRARRLFPALIAVLLVVAAYAQFVAPPTSLGRIRGDGLATLFYFANWHDIFSGHVYGEQFAAQSPLLHTWSLAIEEQFYLVWPLAVWGLLKWRNRPQVILRVSITVAVVSVGLMLGLNAGGVRADPALYEGTHTRIAAIAMGAALAAWYMGRGHTRDHHRRLAIEGGAVLALVFLGAAWALTDLTSTFLFSGGLALCGLAVTLVIAAAAHPEPLAVNRFLSFAPFRWLGLISYGLYLWHWPIFLYLTPSRVGFDGWPLFAFQLFVSLDVATLSYFALERPIRCGAITGATARSAVPGFSALAVIALLATTTSAVPPGGGFAGRKTNTQLIGAAGTTKLMVVGDSVGFGLVVDGLLPQHQQLGISVANGAFVGCNNLLAMGTVRGIKGDVLSPPSSIDCTDRWAGILKQVQPDVVLMLFGVYPLFSVEIDGRRYGSCDAGYHRAYRARLAENARVLTARGATLVIATTPTTDNGFVRDDIPDVDQRVACSNADVKAAARADPSHIKVVDLGGFVCPKDQCKDVVDGAKLRPDGLHFKGPGAEYIARWITPEVLKAAGRGG